VQLEVSTVPASPELRRHLSRLAPSLLLAASRCAAVAVQFLLQVVVGATAGAAGLGVLQLFASWSCIAGEVLARGLPAWAMRVVAVETARPDVDGPSRPLRWAAGRILWLAAAFGLVVLPFIAWADRWLPGDYRQIALAVIVSAPLFALLRLGAEALKGSGKALLAVTLENLVQPGFLLLVCLACWLAGMAPGAVVLLCAGTGGIALALCAVWRALRRRLRPLRGAARGSAPQSNDTADLNALWANGVLSIAFLQLPFLLLPGYATTEDIGIYAVAHKLVNIVTTLLILQCAVFGPAFARAAATTGSRQLRRLLRRTQWLSCVISLPLFAALMLAIDPLAALFNLPARPLGFYLLVLAAGQLVNAATGLSGMLLNMSGGAALETRNLAVAIAAAMLAVPLVGPSHGAIGVAVLCSVVLAGKNLASYLAASVFLSRRDGPL
jgi:O-antigen/teichoic acid export membrane protein